MDSCDQTVYFLSVLILAFVFVLAASIILQRRKQKQSSVHDVETQAPRETREESRQRMEQESDVELNAFAEANEYDHVAMENEVRNEKDEMENALKRFNATKADWIKERSRLENELKKEKSEKEDGLRRFNAAKVDWITERSRLENELKKEKSEKEDGLRRFNVAKDDWIMERSRLENELKKEKSEKEDGLRRFNEANVDLIKVKSQLENELQKERLEKEDALSRLSAIMSSRLKDGNPNVVDLSDENRPTKLGEQFSELYDNEWTDAYSAIENLFGIAKAESEIIQILLNILAMCFTECKVISRNQLDQISENIVTIINKNESSLLTDFMQRIKEERKMNAYNKPPELTMIFLKLKNNFSPKYQDQTFLDEQSVKAYVQECLRLSWLMVIQDPPMTIELKPEHDTHDNFRPYKTRGKYFEFIVWPALFLKNGGPLVMKGVAEFTNVSPDKKQNEV